jgi:hypothetical protein
MTCKNSPLAGQTASSLDQSCDVLERSATTGFVDKSDIDSKIAHFPPDKSLI